MKTSRPRSLDMSSWSVESRSSSSQTTSSSEAGSERPSPNVSRNASFQSNGGSSTVSSPPPTSSGPASITSTTASSSASAGGALTTLTTTTTQVVRWKDHPNKMEAPKTVITIMGGRGYINWRRASVEKQRTSALAQINNSDAFLVIWEMKL